MKKTPLFLSLAVLVIAVPVWGQIATTMTYGTQSRTYLTLSPWNFVPIDSSVTYGYQTSPLGIYRTGGTNWMHAGLQLPEGAAVETIEMNVCDTNNAGGFSAAAIFSGALNGASTLEVLMTPVTDVVEAPGCVVRTFNITPPLIIDNANKAYLLEVNMGPTNPATLVLVAARLGYRLQVSPAPPIARFNDVPTSHPFFQYIEALAAAGITGGCTATPPNYCPDQPVTRGQMAVFIARALGLHWAP